MSSSPTPSDRHDEVAARICIGWGEREGVCENPAGGPPRHNPIWCGECDKARIEHLSLRFEAIKQGFSYGK